MTILLVDDDPISLRLLEMTLRRLGHQTAAVDSGAAALEWLKQESGCELVITDQNMSGMSGLQLFTALKADPRWRGIPIALCTGVADSDTVQDAIQRGVRHYIVKPIKPSVVAAKVSEMLRSQVPVLEARFDAMARLELSEAEYRTLAETTLEHLRALTTALGEARAKEDFVEAIIVARRVREPAELLGAGRLSAAVATLEEASNGWQRDRAVGLVTQETAAVIEALEAVARPVARATAAARAS